MAIRLATALPNTSPEFWLRVQMNYDLWQARKEMKLGEEGCLILRRRTGGE